MIKLKDIIGEDIIRNQRNFKMRNQRWSNEEDVKLHEEICREKQFKKSFPSHMKFGNWEH